MTKIWVKTKNTKPSHNSATNTVASHIISKIRSNSDSSKYSKSSYISPKTSAGSFTTSDIQQRYGKSNNNITTNNTVSSSSHSLTRKNNSIVTALRNFVNLLSSCSSSDRELQLFCNFQQYFPTLEDLPAFPEPYNDKASFKNFFCQEYQIMVNLSGLYWH